MTTVRSCPRFFQWMLVKDDEVEVLDETTIRMTCPHCHELVRLKLVSQGSNATGPKMGH